MAPPVANHGGDPPAVEGLYAPLFQRGRQWTYAISDGKQQSKMTCTVASVATDASGTRSHIDCSAFMDESLLENPLAGDWIAGAGGLSRIDGTHVLDTVPTARHDDRYDRSSPEGASGDPVGATVVEKQGDAWCWEDSSLLGDTQWKTLCFGADGVVSGSAGWQGDTATEVKLTLLH